MQRYNNNTNKSIKINEFFTSIEGEGILLGTKTLFIRLAGCHLKCHWCDTKYALPFNNGTEYTIDEVKDEIVKNIKPFTYKVNFTGGEPLLQYVPLREIIKFVKEELKVKTYLESSCYDHKRFNYLLPYIDICKIEFKLKDSKVVENPNQYEDILKNELECLKTSINKKKTTFIKIVVTSETDEKEFAELLKRIFCYVSSQEISGLIIQPVSHVSEPTVEKLLTIYDISYEFYKEIRIIPQTHKIIGAQ